VSRIKSPIDRNLADRDPILDGPVSAQTVSRMTKILDAAVRAFHRA
jgi:hypothetical protein